MPPIVIAGLGVSGLGCALELTRRKIPFVAIERESRPGGLAKSEARDGFRFDYGPHILLGRPAELDELFRELPGLDLAVCSGCSGIAMDTRLERVVPAPFQRHLHCLPLAIRARLLLGMVAGSVRNGKPPANYQEYAVDRCGRGVYDIFVRGYDSKRLRFDLQAIPPDWTNRVEKPSLRSLILPACLASLQVPKQPPVAVRGESPTPSQSHSPANPGRQSEL